MEKEVMNKPGKVVKLKTSKEKNRYEMALEMEDISKRQEEHPTMSWFDIFYCVLVKENKFSQFTRKVEPVIVGLQLRHKHNLKAFIEPAVVYGGNGLHSGFNAHVIGSCDGNGMGQVYLKANTHKEGELIEDIPYLRDICVLSKEDLTIADIL